MTKDIFKFLLIATAIGTMVYIIFIQSKQGIKVSGSDNVIDPFVYESGVYQDVYNGINPYSTASHISESELQSRKFKKMSSILLYTVPAMLLLFFLSKKKIDDTTESSVVVTEENVSDDEEIRASFVELAIKMTCLPEEVKSNYIREIISNDFSLADLIETENAWKEKKAEDALIMNIKPENTPAALMERWTKEYRISHFKSS